MPEKEKPVLSTDSVELPYENTSQRYMEFYSGKWALDKALKEPESEDI